MVYFLATTTFTSSLFLTFIFRLVVSFIVHLHGYIPLRGHGRSIWLKQKRGG